MFRHMREYSVSKQVEQFAVDNRAALGEGRSLSLPVMQSPTLLHTHTNLETDEISPHYRVQHGKCVETA